MGRRTNQTFKVFRQNTGKFSLSRPMPNFGPPMPWHRLASACIRPCRYVHPCVYYEVNMDNSLEPILNSRKVKKRVAQHLSGCGKFKISIYLKSMWVFILMRSASRLPPREILGWHVEGFPVPRVPLAAVSVVYYGHCRHLEHRATNPLNDHSETRNKLLLSLSNVY